MGHEGRVTAPSSHMGIRRGGPHTLRPIAGRDVEEGGCAPALQGPYERAFLGLQKFWLFGQPWRMFSTRFESMSFVVNILACKLKIVNNRN